MSTSVKQGRRPTDVDRFWSKVDKTDSCWLWKAAINSSGYGQFAVLNRTVQAHRFAREILGVRNADAKVRNLCGKNHCVNPAHWKISKTAERRLAPKLTPEARWWKRFRANVREELRVAELGPCWIWQRAKTQAGYGRVHFQGRVNYAHRAAYIATHGEVSEGLELDHLCRVPSCCNPKHLEPVTHQENCARSPIHVFFHPELRTQFTQPATHCKHGHELTPENRYKGGRGRCAICARRYAAETARLKRHDPEYQERARIRRKARYDRNSADPAFRQRARERSREYYARMKSKTGEE